jgi:hypothetical protein
MAFNVLLVITGFLAVLIGQCAEYYHRGESHGFLLAASTILPYSRQMAGRSFPGWGFWVKTENDNRIRKTISGFSSLAF